VETGITKDNYLSMTKDKKSVFIPKGNGNFDAWPRVLVLIRTLVAQNRFLQYFLTRENGGGDALFSPFGASLMRCD